MRRERRDQPVVVVHPVVALDPLRESETQLREINTHQQQLLDVIGKGGKDVVVMSTPGTERERGRRSRRAHSTRQSA